MNLLYVLYREDIYSPLIEGQVLNILYRMSKKEDVNVHLLWIKRIDYYFRHQEEINKVKSKLAEDNISFYEIPMVVGKLPISGLMSEFVWLQIRGKLKKILHDNNIDVIHTRSYNSGYIALKLRKSGEKFLHVFDPRSPYITEIQSTYGVKKGSGKYNFWVKKEREISLDADATVAVSKDFEEYLNEFGKNVVFIPNNSEMPEKDVACKRAESMKRNSMCFVGSLGYGWNNIYEYISFIKKVLEIDNTIRFELHVMKECINNVLKEMAKSQIPTDSYTVDSLPPDKIGETISGCIAGLQIMSTKDTRLGVKTVEYLSSGVPIICNNNAMGAANIIKEYDVGWNIDLADLREIIDAAKTENKKYIRCIDVAYNNFSTAVVTEMYCKLYKDILDK